MSIEDTRGGVNSTEEVFVSTDLVEDGLRSEFWREATSPFYETTPLTGSENPRLEGSIRSRQAAGLELGSVTFNAQRYNRDRRIIARSGLDQYLVAIVAADMSSDFAGTSVTAGSGDICVLDLVQTLQSEVAPGEMFSVLIPRQALARATGHADLHGLILKSHQPMTKLLSAYLRGLKDFGDQPSDDEAAAVQEALVTILAAALRGEQPEDTGNLRPLSAALRQRALDLIDSHIDDPALGPDLIQRRLNVSRAHLYRAFAADGGVSSVIRDRRLDAAFLALTRTGGAARSISDVAYRFGFTNATHFFRRFRTRFGLTPGEVRQERALHQPNLGLQSHLLHISAKLGQPDRRIE